MDQDLQNAKESFLQRLTGQVEEFAGQGDYAGYWRSVEAQAEITEDMGQLDDWLRELRRDRDKLEELRARKEAAATNQIGGAEVAVEVISMLLALLDDVERRLKQLHARVRDRLGAWIYLLGPGVKRKPLPKGEATDGQEDKQRDAENQKARPKAKPSKKKA